MATHPLLSFLATLPQFEPRLIDGIVFHLRDGVLVGKYDDPDDSHRNTLQLRWFGVEKSIGVNGIRYAELQAREAATLGAGSVESLLDRVAQISGGDRY